MNLLKLISWRLGKFIYLLLKIMTFIYVFDSVRVNNEVKLILVKENIAWFYGKLHLNINRNVLKIQKLKTQLKIWI